MHRKLERNDPCWCGSNKKYKHCHMQFDEKIRAFALEGHLVPDHGIIKTPEQIEGIRESGGNSGGSAGRPARWPVPASLL